MSMQSTKLAACAKRVGTVGLALALGLSVAACGKVSEGVQQSLQGGGGTGGGGAQQGDFVKTAFFTFSVEGAAQYPDGYNGYTPEEGNTVVVVDVLVHNEMDGTITMYDTDFQLQWGDDAEDAFALPVSYQYGATGISDKELPGEYDLAKGEKRDGELIFEAPAGNEDFSLSYMEVYEGGGTGDTFFIYFSAPAGSAKAA